MHNRYFHVQHSEIGSVLWKNRKFSDVRFKSLYKMEINLVNFKLFNNRVGVVDIYDNCKTFW